MTGRDFTAEFVAGLLDAVPDEGDFVPAIVASNYVNRLIATDPALLNGWLIANAPVFATDMLVNRLRHRRSASRLRASAREFADHTDDANYIGSFSIDYKIAPDNTRIRVADMTGAHHLFVAREYAESANTAKMLGAFHRAVAKRVGAQRTADVMTEADYDALYSSIVRGAPTAVAS